MSKLKYSTPIIFLILILFQPCNAQTSIRQNIKENYIDSITSAKQIESLITKINKRYSDFKVNETLIYPGDYSNIDCKKISDSLNVKPWQKGDFDNNGLTDILIIGNWQRHHIICILDKGDNNYEIKSITRRSFQECTFPIVMADTSIEYFYPSYYERGNSDKPKLQNKNLIYKFGDFIESNSNPSNHKIEKIEYSTTACYGTCPIFSLTINPDRFTIWNATSFNEIHKKEIKGEFKTTLEEKQFNLIIHLLNYIDFEKLNESYAVGWTDDQSCILKITYDNGKSKIIRDYGLIGTFGLDRLYQLLFELRENQKWTK